MMDAFDLADSIALVTGGSGGYGRPICEALAEAGAHVVLASRDRNSCEEVAQRLRDKDLKATSACYDQGDENSVKALFDHIRADLGAIDVLVNNAVARPMGRYADSLDSYRRSMEINSVGLFHMSRLFMDSMMARGSGSVINVGSIQSTVAPDFGNYESTDMTTPPDYHFHKHGMLGLTRYFAALGGPRGVRVNLLSPGGLDTGEAREPFVSQYCQRVFLGRLAVTTDIKGAIIFLASRASAYVTGHNLVVDGGYTC